MKTKLVNKNFKDHYIDNLLQSRGILDVDKYYKPTRDCLQNPSDLENVEQAAKLLEQTIKLEQPILIVVDSDNDGFTSAAIMYSYLKDLSPELEIDYVLHEGKQHGLEDHIDNLLNLDKKYSLIILPDSSSNDYKYHEQLKNCNIPVLVLDHHITDEQISNNAIIMQNINDKYTIIDKSMISAYLYVKILNNLKIDEEISKEVLLSYLIKQNIYGGGNSYMFGATPASISGMKLTQLGITDLTYEKSHKLNVGIDFKAWDKLSLSLDAFYDHRTDILVSGSGSVSSIFGMSTPMMNDGIVDNRGIEAVIGWDDKIGNFSYHLGGQFSFTRNKIINQNEEYRPYDYLKRTGGSLGQIYGYEVIGIYQSQEEIDNREVKQYLGTVRPGDLMFKDQNGDNRIDAYDQVALGYNSSCPEIYYSFDLGAEYKGFGLYALFQGAGNYSKLLDTRSVYRPIVGNNTISTYYWENRWSKDNPNGTLPRLTYSGSDNNYNNNSMWVTDASFLKLRTLELYYNFPTQLLNKSRIFGGLKIFARAHDLFCLDGIDLQDPEAIGAVHPTMTQYTFGINMSF